MTIRLVDGGWGHEMDSAIALAADTIQLVSPFIKSRTTRRFLSARPKNLRVITRFNLDDMAAGASDIAALHSLLKAGAQIRGIKNLHSKLYIFGASQVIVTSANMTEAALFRNHEFGFVSQDKKIIATCSSYFDDLWRRGGSDLTMDQLESWAQEVSKHCAAGGRPIHSAGLGDFGADAGFPAAARSDSPVLQIDAPQAFVKFLGMSSDRVPLSFPTIDEVRAAGCHWALAYPVKKRPRSVQDGALMFIARLTQDPNDIRIFGHAIGMRHIEGRDDATAEDIALRSWKATWPRYVRVHHAEFIAGTMEDGISMNDMMSALGATCFAATKRNAAAGKGNVVPHKAYRQQAAVELSAEGQAWLAGRLQLAFDKCGRIPQASLETLDWPDMAGLVE